MCRFVSISCIQGHVFTLADSKITCSDPGDKECLQGSNGPGKYYRDAVIHCTAVSEDRFGMYECQAHLQQYGQSLYRVYKLDGKLPVKINKALNSDPVPIEAQIKHYVAPHRKSRKAAFTVDMGDDEILEEVKQPEKGASGKKYLDLLGLAKLRDEDYFY